MNRLKTLIWILWFLALLVLPLLQPLSVMKDYFPLVATAYTPAWLLMVFKVLYDKWDRFYFGINRLKLRMTNSSISWDFSVELVLPEDKSLDDAYRAILDRLPNATTKINLEIDKVLKMPGYTLFCKLRQDTSIHDLQGALGSILVLQVSDMVAPFRTTWPLIRNEILPLLEHVREAVAPVIDQKYTLKVSFEHGNPYFGLFIRKLDPAQVRYFNCEFTETLAGAQETVSISKDKVSLTTASIASLSALSEKYLTLSSVA